MPSDDLFCRVGGDQDARDKKRMIPRDDRLVYLLILSSSVPPAPH